MEQTLATLRADPRVALATPDRRVRAHAYVPNDPLFAGQWFLKGAQPSAMRVDTAWDITRGGASPSASTVVVAVLDTGVRFDHPDLGRAAKAASCCPATISFPPMPADSSPRRTMVMGGIRIRRIPGIT